MRLIFIVICFFLSSIVYGAENSKARDELNDYLATMYWQRGIEAELAGESATAEREFARSADLLASIEPGIFLGKARGQFRIEKYSEAIANLDIYLRLIDEDTLALLLRGLAKKLTEPPDVEGACADLLEVASLGFDISVVAGIESYCDVDLHLK